LSLGGSSGSDIGVKKHSKLTEKYTSKNTEMWSFSREHENPVNGMKWILIETISFSLNKYSKNAILHIKKKHGANFLLVP
jgi:hypothetical protein